MFNAIKNEIVLENIYNEFEKKNEQVKHIKNIAIFNQIYQ